jgi:hypothetical protein
MKTASANPALAQERCQLPHPHGRQCASRILGPGFSYCVRHSFAQPLLLNHLCLSLPPLNHLTSRTLPLYSRRMPPTSRTPKASITPSPHSTKLLAGGQISPRRATGLAYIASLLLRTLPDVRKQTIETAHFSRSAPARGCVGMSQDDKLPTLPELTSPEEDDPPSLASRTHASQQSPATAQPSLTLAPQPRAPVTQSVTPPAPPSNFPHLPAVASPPR